MEDLRQDALRRTNEMYSRVRCENKTEKPHEPPKHTPVLKEIPSVQSVLGENADRVLLLIIIYLLYKEKADYKILCALLYIFL